MPRIDSYPALTPADADTAVMWDADPGAVKKLSLADLRSYLGIAAPEGGAKVLVETTEKEIAGLEIQSDVGNASFPTSSSNHYAQRPLKLLINQLADSANITSNLDVIQYGLFTHLIVGSATVNARGTHHARTTIADFPGVHSDGTNACEGAFDMAWMRIGSPGKSNVPLRAWFTDWTLHGNINTQPKLLNGITMCINNYANASPADGPSAACWLVTKQGAGAGGEIGHASATSYPVDVGLGIVGNSGAGGAGIGFSKAIQVGGWGSGWMNGGDSSNIGTVLDATDYNTGIYLHGRIGTGYAIRVTSDAGAVRFDGDITDGTNTVTVAQLAALVAAHP